MKKIVLYTLVLASLLFALAACTYTKTITISNNGTADYCEIYYTKAETEEWSENQLKDGAVVSPGGSQEFNVTDAGDYTVRVVTCDGNEQTLPVNVP